MKGSCTLVASVLAASTVALGSSSSTADRDTSARSWSNEGFYYSSSSAKNDAANSRRSSEEKFAPRFDGLRFIETLVTAHR